MREEEEEDDKTTTTFRPILYFGHIFEKGTYLCTYPPEDLTLLKRKEKEDLEEDDVDDDSEGEKGTYSSASCCRLIRV